MGCVGNVANNNYSLCGNTLLSTEHGLNISFSQYLLNKADFTAMWGLPKRRRADGPAQTPRRQAR